MSHTVSPSILFLTKYSHKGASSRYRTLQYIPFFENSGLCCTVSPLFDDDYLDYRYRKGRVSRSAVLTAFLRRAQALLGCKNYDVLVIEKELFPYFPAFATRVLGWLGVPYIIDIDDALFHQYDGNRFSIIRLLLGNKISKVMNGASLVVAGSEYLADYAKGAGSKDVQIVPTVIDLERYPTPRRRSTVESVFTIGWIGSPSTAMYLEAIAPALAEVCSDGKARVMLIGSGPFTLSGVPLDIVSWSEASEVECLSDLDVGIMPLPNEPWERGKCGLKLIQYMACGLPVVASPVGVNADIVENQDNGFLAEDHDSWVRALTTLRDNADLRSNLGRKGRAKVEIEYSLQTWAKELAALLGAQCHSKINAP